MVPSAMNIVSINVLLLPVFVITGAAATGDKPNFKVRNSSANGTGCPMVASVSDLNRAASTVVGGFEHDWRVWDVYVRIQLDKKYQG